MRIGTRGSPLALAQANLVAALLGDCEIVPVLTGGDRNTDAELRAAGEDKSRWVAELESALLEGEIDVAVHSAKDVPGELAQGLCLLGATARAPAQDVLCGADSLDELAPGARIGTSSLRRAAQLRAAREDIDIAPIAGNVDTRLGKLAGTGDARLDAIVLARAGLQRLGRESQIGAVLDPERFVPAPGQGVLALEGRAGDGELAAALAAITDPAAFACLRAERALAAELQASCNTPLGAHAMLAGDEELLLRTWVGMPDGSAWLADQLLGDLHDPEALGRLAAERLNGAGAAELLRRAEEMADVGGR